MKETEITQIKKAFQWEPLVGKTLKQWWQTLNLLSSDEKKSSVSPCDLIHFIPRASWIQDLSLVKDYLDSQKKPETTSFSSYLEGHPEVVDECISHLKVLHANGLALEVFGVKTIEELTEKVKDFYRRDSYHAFKHLIVGLKKGDFYVKAETEKGDPRGHEFDTWVCWSTSPETKKPSSNILATLVPAQSQDKLSIIESGQLRVLEYLARGAPLNDLLGELMAAFENYFTGARSTIFFYNEGSRQLENPLALQMPDEFLQLLRVMPVGPEAPPCGRAAYYQKRMVVADVEGAEVCSTMRSLVDRFDLRSCWSQPVISSEGKTLGVFSFFHEGRRIPDPQESLLLKSGAYIASLAIERRKSEEALIESEAWIRSLVEVAGTAIVCFSTDGTVTEWNQEAEKVFGFKRADVIGRSLEEGTFFSEHTLEVLARQRQDVMFGEELRDFELPLENRQGDERILLWNMTRLLSPKGEIIGIVGAGQDITDRKATERQLRKAKMMAEAAGRAKMNFMANVNHELRTPLAAIAGLSELLDDFSLSEKEEKECLFKIRRNTDQLLQMVNDILDLSRIEADRISINKQRFSLMKFLEDVLALLKEQAMAKELELNLDLSTAIPEKICSDPIRVRQVLIHVIGNAIKFTDQGSIDVSIGLVPSEKGLAYPLLKFRVRDSGCGVPSHSQGRLFQPFYQNDSSTTRRYGGTGLGLALSQRLAGSLGGYVELESSREGQGSVFSVVIDPGPLDKDPLMTIFDWDELSAMTENQESSSEEKVVSLLSGVRVLIAEDFSDFQVILARVLRSRGAIVHLAENGQEALTEALRESFDVILMDLAMPVMDGYTATKKLREKGYDGTILALTAKAIKGEKSRCRQLGFDDYLIKPVGHDRLINHISRHRRRPRHREGGRETSGPTPPQLA